MHEASFPPWLRSPHKGVPRKNGLKPQGGTEEKWSQNAHLLRVNCAFSTIFALP
jgi:hypothetical protein